MTPWQSIQHWNTDDELDTWLKQHGLANSQAIINKVALGEDLIFANDTRRLRYAEGTFYLESREPDADIGTGEHLDLNALRERFQQLAGKAKVTIKFDKSLPVASSIKIWATEKAVGYDIRLNPARLQGRKQVAEHVGLIEQAINM